MVAAFRCLRRRSFFPAAAKPAVHCHRQGLSGRRHGTARNLISGIRLCLETACQTPGLCQQAGQRLVVPPPPVLQQLRPEPEVLRQTAVARPAHRCPARAWPKSTRNWLRVPSGRKGKLLASSGPTIHPGSDVSQASSQSLSLRGLAIKLALSFDTFSHTPQLRRFLFLAINRSKHHPVFLCSTESKAVPELPISAQVQSTLCHVQLPQPVQTAAGRLTPCTFC
ncbi:hypothetical protein IWX90DRAFT_139322 [Phyllosticta citrichinensis]|uniref:Uncharacterized protein n=1 Tax=Phyllosticta citrichinensis TaxID=1130410 RepID=A0ABR1XYJ4_9PEZI